VEAGSKTRSFGFCVFSEFFLLLLFPVFFGSLHFVFFVSLQPGLQALCVIQKGKVTTFNLP